MKRALFVIALWLAPFSAYAQCNGVFPNNTLCGNVSGAGNLPRPVPNNVLTGVPGGTPGQIQYNNAGATFGGFTMSGDCTTNTSTGVITCGPPSTGLVPTVRGGTGVSNATNSAGDILTSSSTNGTFLARSLNALCTLAPSACTAALGYTNLRWYGTQCNGLFQSNQNFDPYVPTDISITSGTPNLTSTGSTFTSADVGKRIWVPRAGPAAAGLSTTILAFVDATHVTLATNASSTVTAFAVTNAEPLVYGTDDTAAIQAAFDGTPIGGTLFIPGDSSGGCLFKTQIAQTRPFNVIGQGQRSNLMTDPSFDGSANLAITAGAYNWQGMIWENFNLSAVQVFNPSTYIPVPRFGGQGMRFTAPGSGFKNITIRNVQIGESGAGSSLYVSGVATQSLLIQGNIIWGGIHLDAIADSGKMLNNFLAGFSAFAVIIDFPGAGSFLFKGNNFTAAGGLRFESGLMPIVTENYIEECCVTSSLNNALVDFSCTVSGCGMPIFTNNIVQIFNSPTAQLVRFSATATNGIFGGNYLSAFSARTGVTSNTSLSCTAPNVWSIGGGTHFSTALANSYAGC